ncbi:hypothetical protein [Gaetbulibacter saemankumensis]|uniref:hypothetical protein n=1 Tax=Gaetbulibacter saemankumensis TaxID=311208 RepID=UPI0004120068|nr:hypothetical protein [Gaetbulibacter saemankumensis]
MSTNKVTIPAFFESNTISKVVEAIWVIINEAGFFLYNFIEIIVESTKKIEPTTLFKKYGKAYLKASDCITHSNQNPNIIVFLDKDHSDYPKESTNIVNHLISNNIDMVISTRIPKLREPKNITPQKNFKNLSAIRLRPFLFQVKHISLGSFPYIKNTLSYPETPVIYRNRIGVSKVSNTIKWSFLAEVKILSSIFKYSIKK